MHRWIAVLGVCLLVGIAVWPRATRERPEPKQPERLPPPLVLEQQMIRGSEKAAVQLTTHKTPETREMVMIRLADEALPMDKRNALCSGIAMGGPEWVPHLLSTLQNTKSDATALFCLSALANVAPAQVEALYYLNRWRELLLRHVDGDDFMLKTHAIIAMGASGDVDRLARGFNANTQPKYRETWARALAVNGSNPAIDTLLADESDDALRAAALVAPHRALAVIDRRKITTGVVDALYSMGAKERLRLIARGESKHRGRALQALFELDPSGTEPELHRAKHSDPELKPLCEKLIDRWNSMKRFGGN